MSIYDALPLELREYDQWICWRYGAPNADGKRAKEPIDPHTGRLAGTNKPITWATFEKACAAATGDLGLGFVLTENDPYTFIDLDGVIDEAGNMDRRAYMFLEKFDSYCEYSPSGRGVHLWVRATFTGPGINIRETPFGFPVEIYCRGRFATMTGRRIPVLS